MIVTELVFHPEMSTLNAVAPETFVPCSSPSLCPKRDVRVESCLKPEHGVHARHSADVPRVHVTRLTCRVVDEAGIDSGFQVISVCVRVCLCPTTERENKKNPKKHAGGFLPSPRSRRRARACDRRSRGEVGVSRQRGSRQRALA